MLDNVKGFVGNDKAVNIDNKAVFFDDSNKWLLKTVTYIAFIGMSIHWQFSLQDAI